MLVNSYFNQISAESGHPNSVEKYDKVEKICEVGQKVASQIISGFLQKIYNKYSYIMLDNG